MLLNNAEPSRKKSKRRNLISLSHLICANQPISKPTLHQLMSRLIPDHFCFRRVEKLFSKLFQRDVALRRVKVLQQRLEEDVNDGGNQGLAAGRASGVL